MVRRRKFSFLRLSQLAIHRIIMMVDDEMDLIMFSLASRRCRMIMMSARLRVDELTFFASTRNIQVLKIFSHAEMFYDTIEFTLKRCSNEKWNDLVWRYLQNNAPEMSWATSQSSSVPPQSPLFSCVLESVPVLIHHNPKGGLTFYTKSTDPLPLVTNLLLDIYQFRSFAIFGGVSLALPALLQSASYYEMSSLFINPNVRLQQLIDIAENLKIRTFLFDGIFLPGDRGHSHSPAIFPFPGNKTLFPYKTVDFKSGCGWLTVEMLLGMTCESFTLKQHSLSDSDLNKFIKSWIQGGYEQLKEFVLELRVINGEIVFLDPKVVLEGIEWRATQDPYRHDIARSDGKTATAYLGDTFSRFSLTIGTREGEEREGERVEP